METVPIEWFFTVGGALIGGFIWWIKERFRRNDQEHAQNYEAIRDLRNRVDHLTFHLLPNKPYKEEL